MPRVGSILACVTIFCGLAKGRGAEMSAIVAPFAVSEYLSWRFQSPVEPPAAPHQATTAAATRPATDKIVVAEEEFELEIASDAASREKGLMHRDKIDEHGGMLFIYPEIQDELGFWMKNCLIDIDILYLDAKGRIVATHAMKAEPPKRESETERQYEDRLKRYPSRRPAQFAIELKAGSIERLKIGPGQAIEMDVKRLKAMAE